MQTQINVNVDQARSVKFTYNNDIRRLTMKPETTLAEMVSIIRSLISVEESPLVIKYLDDENEWVTLEKDLEFETALLVGGHPIKLAVSLCDHRPCFREKKWKKGGKCGKKGGRGKKAYGGQRGKRFQKARRADDDVSDKDLADAETETSSEHKSEWKGRRGARGHGRRGKRFQKDEASEHHSEVETETSSEKPKWKGRRGGRGHGRKWHKNADEHSEKSETTSTSVESSLNPEEVKSKINSLFEQKKVVFERLKEAKEKLNLKKQAIKECRQVPERKEEIPALRVDLIEAKKAKFAVWDELFAIKTEIRELKASLKVKAAGIQTE